MNNEEEAIKRAKGYYGNDEQKSRIAYSFFCDGAEWKEEQFKQLLIDKAKLLSPSSAQDSVKRCTIEEIYREMFNEEMPNLNPYIK